MDVPLQIRSADDCLWDCVALGEVMLRFDPGENRIANTRTFHVWEGGGEYNVARALRRCFGLRTTVVTALADNPVGRLVEDLVLQGGVHTSHILWVPGDGIGRVARNGLNFAERGYGLRGAVGCSDRGHTAVSQLEVGDIDWHTIFAREGTRWLHCGGIFAGLSETTADVAEHAMRAARAAGAVVSYDLNFRSSLWEGIGGSARAVEVNRKLTSLVDVLFGNEEDFNAALGYETAGVSDDYEQLDADAYGRMLREVVDDFPNLRIVATSLRTVRSASRNDWGGLCFANDRVIIGGERADLEILDRVGGGDSFASGLIYGLLAGRPLEDSLELAIAHGALAMTTPGDTSMATLAEVERVAAGAAGRVRR